MCVSACVWLSVYDSVLVSQQPCGSGAVAAVCPSPAPDWRSAGSSHTPPGNRPQSPTPWTTTIRSSLNRCFHPQWHTGGDLNLESSWSLQWNYLQNNVYMESCVKECCCSNHGWVRVKAELYFSDSVTDRHTHGVGRIGWIYTTPTALRAESNSPPEQ